MKKILICLSLLYVGITFYQCSYDEECEQIDWIGIYTIAPTSTTLQTSCTNTQGENIFPEELIIEAGSNSNKIIVNGTEVEYRNCNVELSIGIFDIEFREYRISQSGSVCSAVYTKS